MPGYKVIALVSGGKDSCYNALLCEQEGHQLVALGNLHPSDTSVEELDSYMYQTVGHGLIEAYAECTGLPLLRKRIVGSSVEQGLIYNGQGATAGQELGHRGGDGEEGDSLGDGSCRRDEVEDLEVLLQFAKDRFGIDAVASGAIASDYQRSRVERICSKLNLISLAYMWHQPQSTLLREMIMNDIDARLIKVAAAGLDPERHLGKSIRSVEAYLHKLRAMYGINVCGEGGEYETLTLDCPLFRCGRIVIDEHEVVVAMPDSLAPVAWMRVVRFHIEKKAEAAVSRDGDLAEVIQVPDDYVSEAEMREPGGRPGTVDQDAEHGSSIVVECSGRDMAMQAFQGYCSTSEGFHSMLKRLKQLIEGEGRCMETDCVFVTLFVEDMGRFAAINEVYSRHFPPVNPPSRATLQKSGPGISIQVLCSSKPRSVLHVQSLSRWAPSCIGPYSQAVACGGMVRYSGQIALRPESSTLVCGGLEAEVTRVALTCDLLGEAMKIDWASTLLWSTLYVSDSYPNDVLARLLKRRDSDAIEGASGSDDADQGDDLGCLANGGTSYVEEYLAAVKNTKVQVQPEAMTLVVECPCLPRNACIEIQSVHAGIESILYTDPDSSSDEEELEAQKVARAEHGWLQDLTYIHSSTLPFHFRAVYAPGKFAKIHMTSGVSCSILARDIAGTIAPVLEAATLTTEDLSFANGYVVERNDREELQEALRAALGAPAFVVEVSAVSLFDFGQQKATIAVELLFAS